MAESFEANRIWAPSIRLGSFILHDQKAICYRQKTSQAYLLLLNEVQRVCHENSIDRWKAEAGTPDIPQCLTNFDSAVMVRHALQSSGVQIDGMNRAAGSQQVRKRRREGAAAATKITPGLRSRPFNEWCTNECDGLTGLHLFNVLERVGYLVRLSRMNVVEWLLDSDPAIRWQVLRDLVHAPAEIIAAERARVATEGWGARLLALQDKDGQWAGGACFPAPSNDQADETEGQPWTSTLPTLQLLYDFGIDPRSDRVRRTVALVRDHCRWEHAGQPFFAGEVEPCINGRTVTLGIYFGQDVEAIVVRLLREQLEDGGWNCEAENGSVRSSFATTINVLEGLLAYERATGGSLKFIAARRRGEEYLLERKLFRRKSTGEVVDPLWLQFSFPVRWQYDVLRALDYFRSAGHGPDSRMDEAMDLLRSKRQPDGIWLLANTHPGKVHFALEDGDGRPSRWNTLRTLRVLRWYEESAT